ncbi:MAG TPA: spore coat protein CotJB [Bacillota bacterium]|nr:spore coat protein CotJB [Bacillota bacterium]
MYRDQLDMLKNLQALEFTAVDLNLYLDTHPTDQRAFQDFQNIVQQMESLRQNYARCYGPLIPSDAAHHATWRWTEEPWPWEIEY